jgi:hypothetical protein
MHSHTCPERAGTDDEWIIESAFHPTATSAPKEVSSASRPQTKVTEGISGEHLIGIVFAASALVVGGGFFWTLARVLETYRVY